MNENSPSPNFDSDAAITAVDQFAGPGGWDLAATELGLDVIGIEYDAAANSTRRECGYKTIEDDILNVAPFPATMLISSPSCQSFSTAGKGAGRRALDQVLSDIDALSKGEPFRPETYDDVRTALVLTPLVWVLAMHKAGTPYRHLSFEQVPPVKPVWEAMLAVFESLGYQGEVGLVQAEAYGVPQTRKRAILVASLDFDPQLPTPTHSKYYPRSPDKLDEGVQKWVSMAEALGWGMTAKPSMTVTGGGGSTGGAEPFGNAARQSMKRERSDGRWEAGDYHHIEAVGMRGKGMIERYGERPGRPADMPAPTVRANGGSNASPGFQWKDTSVQDEDTNPSDELSGLVHDTNNTTRWGTEGETRYQRPVEYPSPVITSTSNRDTVGKAGFTTEQRREALAAESRFIQGNQKPTGTNYQRRDEDQPSMAVTGKSHLYKVGNDGEDDPRGAKITAAKKPVLRHSPYAGMLFNGGGRPVDADKPAPVMTATAGGNRSHIVDETGGEFIESYHAKVAAGEKPPELKNAPLRRLTLDEAAVLQSFPLEYPWQGTKTKRFEQVGNAVPPLLAWHVLKQFAPGHAETTSRDA